MEENGPGTLFFSTVPSPMRLAGSSYPTAALFRPSPPRLRRRRSAFGSRSCSAMESAGVGKGEKEEEEKKIEIGKMDKKPAEPSPPLLQPPEKPLPGDCCGSGCVRCVWDIYYEELETYNESLRLDSETK